MNPSRLMYVVLASFLTLPALSQDMTGFVTGNYSGVNSTMVNPSMMINSKLYLDINIASAGFFVHNNYLYWSNSKCATWELLKKNPNMDPFAPEDYAFYDKYGSEFNHILKNGYFSSRIRGPSVMISGPKHAFALTIDQRNAFSARDVPYHVAKFAYESLDYTPQQNIPYTGSNIKIASLLTTEIGLSYAGLLYSEGLDMWSGGISVKYIIANGGAFMDSRELNYIVPHDSLLIIESWDVDYGYALPMNYSSTTSAYEGGYNLGNGYGIDIGFTYQRMSGKSRRSSRPGSQALCSAEHKPYDYKFGVSLMDIGRVNMKTNAELYSIPDMSTYWPRIDTVKFRSLDDFSTTISNQFFGDPDSSLVGTEFKVGLPTYISIQFDGHINNGFYIGGLFSYPVRLYKHSVRRPATIFIIPRFETRWIEVSIPFSFYDFAEPRLGFSIRLMNFTFGVDHISCLNPMDYRSLNVYAGLKLNFEKGSCKQGKKKTRKKKRKGSRYDNIPCESYE